MAINRLFTTLFLAWGFSVTLLAQAEKSLVVVAGDAVSSISLKDIRSIKYSDDKMVVSSVYGLSDSWDIANLSRISFGETQATSVAPIFPAEVEFDGSKISVTAHSGSELRVYDANGRLLQLEKLTSAQAIINVARWNSGLYIINVGGKIYKFFKK